MLKFLLRHIHFIQSYYNNGAIFSMYWLGPQTKIFPSSWFCLKEALISNELLFTSMEFDSVPVEYNRKSAPFCSCVSFR